MAANTPGPNDVPFTQYLRPHGRPVDVWIERDPHVAALAKRLVEAGYRFDIEELSDRTVSMTVEKRDMREDDAPIAIELCPNGPDVPGMVDKLITTAASRLLKATP